MIENINTMCPITNNTIKEWLEERKAQPIPNQTYLGLYEGVKIQDINELTEHLR